ncbi:calcium-binding protein E63-1-like, partial [Aedes albopictus]|uniref:EF-hand domain-containing protein n=1 Tax=Aedes albopictus TaxID=7160 RepID=A0ABM1YTA5_AEDAL
FIFNYLILPSLPGSGLIDETEFLQWVARIQALKEESNTSSSGSSSSNSTTQAADDDLTQDLVAAFRVFDRDGNGYITRDELKSAMDMIGENVTEYQLNEMLELADADKDGRINYEGRYLRLDLVKQSVVAVMVVV